MRPICLAPAPSYAWLLRGFLHQWNKYAPWPITIYGTANPDALANFVSIGSPEEFPKERWSDALIRALDLAGEETVLFMLEDYWLTRPVNEHAVDIAANLMRNISTLALFHLSSDRIYDSGWVVPERRQEFGAVGSVDVFESLEREYRFNTQAALWKTSLIRQVLQSGESPWETELNATTRMNARPSLQVFSTYQWPVRYANVMQRGSLVRDGSNIRPARTLEPSDWVELDRLGLTHP